MKMKVLPPTLRKNSRYLTLDIKCEEAISKDELVLAIWDSCIRFAGECETSNFNLWLMRFYPQDDDSSYFHIKAILRCQRGFENKVRASLSTITRYNHKKIAFNTIGLSGTISSSIDKFIN